MASGLLAFIIGSEVRIFSNESTPTSLSSTRFFFSVQVYTEQMMIRFFPSFFQKAFFSFKNKFFLVCIF